MTVLLITGLSVIVFGLSLMVMWRTLTVTAANQENALTQLGKMYIGIILAGLVIFATGMIMWGVCQYHQGGIAIMATGAAVMTLGVTSEISAYRICYQAFNQSFYVQTERLFYAQ